jgi:hypothetical protein
MFHKFRKPLIGLFIGLICSALFYGLWIFFYLFSVIIGGSDGPIFLFDVELGKLIGNILLLMVLASPLLGLIIGIFFLKGKKSIR